MKRLLRWSFNLAAVVSALLFVGGCIIVPVPHGHNPFNDAIGGAGSAAPVRVGVSDRARVLTELGKPRDASTEENPGWSWRYGASTTAAYVVFLWPLIHGGPIQPLYREDELAIWFGAEGKVRRFETWSSGGGILPEDKDTRPPDIAAEDAERMAAREKARSGIPATLPTNHPR